MKVDKIEGSAQRRILIGMVTDRTTLARLASRWDGNDGLFSSPHENTVAGWCVKYFRKYDKAPGKDIENIFAEWSARRDHDDTSKMIDKFLSSLSEEYVASPCSSEYLIDLAGKHFAKVAAKKLITQLEIDLESDDVDAVKKRVAECRWVDLGQDATYDGYDYAIWESAFDESDAKVLLEYPGDLGDFIGGELARDSFVAFMASSKRGKTWWLVDLAYRLMKRRNKVAYFEAGDLSRDQLFRRFGIRCLRRPRKETTILLPVGYDSVQAGPILEERLKAAATPNEAFKEWKRVNQDENQMRIRCYPNGSLTTVEIGVLLKEWARDGWVADAVVIDYADLLAPPLGIPANDREGINENWKYMRRISQEMHCLVVTATQADAESYDRKVLTRRNFSGDRRKHDHVTAMLALNATDEDKKQGVTRVNFLDRRDAEYTEMAQVYVAGCLAIGCPVIKSTRWRQDA